MPVEAQQREKLRGSRELSQICSDLHMSMNGSSDPMSDQDAKYDYETLVCAVAGWIPDEIEYNNCQLALVKATIKEYESLHKS